MKEVAEEAQELAASSQNETKEKVKELAAAQQMLDELRAQLEGRKPTRNVITTNELDKECESDNFIGT